LLKSNSNVTDVTDYIGLHGHVNLTDGFGPAFDAVQKVSDVIVAFVQVNIVWPEFRFQQLLRMGVKA
jgi:hypothetical protein